MGAQLSSLEITLYGSSRQTYEAVTQVPGSYAKCMAGIEALLARAIPFRLKSMVLIANVDELPGMKEFARKLGVAFRFDAMVNPRSNGDKGPCQWRLSPSEVVQLDMDDQPRLEALQEFCKEFMAEKQSNHPLYSCGAGLTSFNITPYGNMQICGMLFQSGPDLRHQPFAQGWQGLLAGHQQDSTSDRFRCRKCELAPLCSQCPGLAMTEHGNPWHGEAGHCVAASGPMAELFFIEPGPKNSCWPKS